MKHKPKKEKDWKEKKKDRESVNYWTTSSNLIYSESPKERRGRETEKTIERNIG